MSQKLELTDRAKELNRRPSCKCPAGRGSSSVPPLPAGWGWRRRASGSRMFSGKGGKGSWGTGLTRERAGRAGTATEGRRRLLWLRNQPVSSSPPSPQHIPRLGPPGGAQSTCKGSWDSPVFSQDLFIEQEWFSSQRLLFRGPLGMLPRPLATGEVFKPDLPSASLCQSLNSAGGVNVWTQRFREHNFIHHRCQSSIIY